MVSDPRAARPAVFLDRDGVVVIPEFRDGRSFAPRTLEALEFYDSAAHHLNRLREAGYLLVIVTNQPDVSRGIIPHEVLCEMHRRLDAELRPDLILACIHDNQDQCGCRKPKPGMLLDAAARLNIDLAASVMVGDRTSDVEAGRAAGCRTVFIDLDYRDPKPANANFLVQSLGEAVDTILRTA
jgi:D-glycero-D-manno-heptose 1,7-bisphosphate phosphatase